MSRTDYVIVQTKSYILRMNREENLCWFHGKISREDAEDILRRESNYTVVSELLKCGYRNIDSKNQDGQTAVHLACVHADDKILLKLIERGANINSRDAKGNTPLHYACAKRNGLEMVRMLIKASASLQARNSETGWVPLHEAADNGNMDAVQELLSHRVPHRPRTNFGEMPSDLARLRGHHQVVDFLNAYEPPRPHTHRDLWYHGTLERIAAVEYLKDFAAKLLPSLVHKQQQQQQERENNKENSECLDGLEQSTSGAYLVRYSAKQNVDVLTMLYGNEPKHFIIQRQQDWLYIDEGPYMNSLEHLIEHYTRFSDGLPINLRFPVRPGPKPPIPAFATIPKSKHRLHRSTTDGVPSVLSSPQHSTNGGSMRTSGLTSMFRKSSESQSITITPLSPTKGQPMRNLSVPNDAMLQMNRVGLFDRSPERSAPETPRRTSKGGATSPSTDEPKTKPSNSNASPTLKKAIMDGMKSLRKSKPKAKSAATDPEGAAGQVEVIPSSTVNTSSIEPTVSPSKLLQQLKFSSDFNLVASCAAVDDIYKIPTNNCAIVDIDIGEPPVAATVPVLSTSSLASLTDDTELPPAIPPKLSANVLNNNISGTPEDVLPPSAIQPSRSMPTNYIMTKTVPIFSSISVEECQTPTSPTCGGQMRASKLFERLDSNQSSFSRASVLSGESVFFAMFQQQQQQQQQQN
uniref:SH2 domain-containing protein n=1 Tax=Anopheles epiroticus TaxID=199890 RepID=A0A182PM16_9DIPT